ncbi:spore-wall fungal hydrophobin dewA [Aspergillus ambiguus]|uniref:spore-wall fungal hydrophobin dewA n=1 Tax=Aspergillus ambiguus TaxID=176160 RepID=UPI003CCDC4B0
MISLLQALFLISSFSRMSFAQDGNSTISNSPAMKDAKESQCVVGDIACCDSIHQSEGHGLLGDLLSEGLLHSLIGNNDSPCAKLSLIEELGILSLIKDSEDGPVCKNIIACCPVGTTTCVAIDNSKPNSKAKD